MPGRRNKLLALIFSPAMTEKTGRMSLCLTFYEGFTAFFIVFTFG
jgi:hypothetical protein